MKIDWDAVARLGAGGAIAMYLVYRMATGFDVFETRLRAIEAQHNDMLNHSARVEDLMVRAYKSSERILWVLKVQCANAAKTSDAKQLCFQDQ